jgi:predicted transcriptional regulator
VRFTNDRPIAKAANLSEESAIQATGSFGEGDADNTVFLTACDDNNEGDTGLTPSSARRYSIARELYAKRRKIDEIFETAGFAVSPAWDIMLDLFQADAQFKSLSVSSACLGAACPSTTALRYLRMLERDGFIERISDPNDKRRAFVALTGEGRRRMEMALDLHLKMRFERPEF